MGSLPSTVPDGTPLNDVLDALVQLHPVATDGQPSMKSVVGRSSFLRKGRRRTVEHGFRHLTDPAGATFKIVEVPEEEGPRAGCDPERPVLQGRTLHWARQDDVRRLVERVPVLERVRELNPAAARIDARPGLPIGPGGRPGCR